MALALFHIFSRSALSPPTSFLCVTLEVGELVGRDLMFRCALSKFNLEHSRITCASVSLAPGSLHSGQNLK